MGPFRALIGAVLTAACLLAGCTHATPQVVQVFSQLNRVWDPAEAAWTAKLAVFLQAASADGNKVFDRLHLINDGRELVFTLTSGQWTSVERPGELWLGTSALVLPDGTAPTGSWRALLVTRDGQKVEAPFQVPPTPPDAPPARSAPVEVKALPGTPGRYRVSGWVDDTLVWSRDAKGTVVSRTKVVGPEFAVAGNAASFVLYSYDKARGEGLEAGPFPVQDPAKPADR